MAQHWIATEPGGPDLYTFTEFDVPAPGPGEVTVQVKAAGVNPVDIVPTTGADPAGFPLAIGMEAAGVVTAVGERTRIASGPVAVGDAVIVHPVQGAWATEFNVSGESVLAKPAGLDYPAAANLLLAGCTAAEALKAIGANANDRILVHGASGAVGLSLIQQAISLGITVIGTASKRNEDVVARFGAVPVGYGGGLADRVRAAVPDGITAAIDCVGTDEAVDVSLELLGSQDRFLTIAAFPRALIAPLPFIAGNTPDSAAYRLTVRQGLIDRAATGELQVSIARTFPLDDAPSAVKLLASQHPGGKLALIP